MACIICRYAFPSTCRHAARKLARFHSKPKNRELRALEGCKLLLPRDASPPLRSNGRRIRRHPVPGLRHHLRAAAAHSAGNALQAQSRGSRRRRHHQPAGRCRRIAHEVLAGGASDAFVRSRPGLVAHQDVASRAGLQPHEIAGGEPHGAGGQSEEGAVGADGARGAFGAGVLVRVDHVLARLAGGAELAGTVYVPFRFVAQKLKA